MCSFSRCRTIIWAPSQTCVAGNVTRSTLKCQKQHNLIIAGALDPHKSGFARGAPVAVMTAVVLVSALTTHHAAPERPSATSIYMRNLTRAAQSGLVGLMLNGPCRQPRPRRHPGPGHEEIPSIKKPLFFKTISGLVDVSCPVCCFF